MRCAASFSTEPPNAESSTYGARRHELSHVGCAGVHRQHARLECMEHLLTHVVRLVGILEREVEGVAPKDGMLAALRQCTGLVSTGGPWVRVQATSWAIHAAWKQRRETLHELFAPIPRAAVLGDEGRARHGAPSGWRHMAKGGCAIGCSKRC